jgi:hypothetical protein
MNILTSETRRGVNVLRDVSISECHTGSAEECKHKIEAAPKSIE